MNDELPPFSISGFEVYETVNNPKFEVKEDSNKFVALNGTIKEIAYYDEMFENSFDEDYEGMSNTGNVSFPKISSRFSKGKKICLKKQNDTGDVLKWDDLESCLLGFISDITFKVDEVDVKLVGMSKLLDQEKKFTFKNNLMCNIKKIPKGNAFGDFNIYTIFLHFTSRAFYTLPKSSAT